MSIVDQQIEYVEAPCTLQAQHPVAWFSPRTLSAINPHPHDRSIRYTSARSFFVTWFESASMGNSDTVSVTSLLPHTSRPTDAEPGTVVHDERRERGIQVHTWIEHVLNGLPAAVAGTSGLYRQVVEHVAGIPEPPWRTEMPVRSSADTRVVGVVDALFVVGVEEDGTLVLDMVDWKYSADAAACVEDYSLQLNMYKYILETAYVGMPFNALGRPCSSIRIRTMSIVLFHESHAAAVAVPVADYQAEVARYFAARKKELNQER